MANRRGRGGGGGGTKANERAGTVAPSEVGTHVVDLNSRSATHIASIVFYPVQQHNQAIMLFGVHDCLVVCQHFRHWLQTAGTPDIREVVRIDDIELNLIAPNTKGSIFFLENAATLEGEPSAPVSIFALHIPNDKHVRYLWTPLSPSLLLTELAIHGLIGPPVIPSDQFKPDFSPTGATLPPYHHTVFTIISQCFESATKYPDSPEMIKATRISDVCPSILDPATAHRRIDAADTLHSSHDPNANGKDLSDDRYILELHPAERELASLLYVGCAEYLFIKRTYFKAFSRETVLHAAKVRRAAAHMRNMNIAAGTAQVKVKDEEDEDQGDADDDKEKDDPPAGSSSAQNPRATPSTTRSRTHTRQAADQQIASQVAPDDEQRYKIPTTYGAKPRAAPSTASSRMRSQRASNQQSVNSAVPLASTEQMDVTMKDTEDDVEKLSEDPPAETHNSRVTRLRVRTRGSTANPIANPVINLVVAQNVAQATPLASIEQNDVTMKDQKDDDMKQREEPPADTPDPRAARSAARTRGPTANSVANRVAKPVVNSMAAQNVNRAAPLASTEHNDIVMEDKEDEKDGNKKSDDPPADTPNPRAARAGARLRRSAASSAADSSATQNVNIATPIARAERSDTLMEDREDDQDRGKNDPKVGSANPKRPRGRPKRQSAASSVATRKANTAISLASTQQVKLKEEGKGFVVEGDNENDDSPAESSEPQAEPPPKRARGRPRGPTRQSITNLVATGDDKAKHNSSAHRPIPTIPKAKPMAAAHRTRRSAADSLSEDEYQDDNQSNDSPAPTESSNARETPAATRARVRADRPRLSSTQLAAVRSSAAQVGARNRALRVRTENKHIRTLEEQAGFTYRLASKWILGWNVLGFLDEERVLAVQEGNDDDGENEWSE
jgi:hypothetical protein